MRTIRMPGGISISISGISSFESYHRVIDSMQSSLVPLKQLLDLLKTILLIKDCIADPTLLNALVAQAMKLLMYLPQVWIPLMIKDMVQVLIDLITLVTSKISEIQRLMVQDAQVTANLTVDPNLMKVSLKVKVQIAEAKGELAEMLEPLTLMFDIIATFCAIVGIPNPVPIAEMTDDLDTLKQKLFDLQEYLNEFIAAMGGAK